MTSKEYQHLYYVAHREKVLARGRQRVASGASREAGKRWYQKNIELERTRNRDQMRMKRKPQRLAKAEAREQQRAQ